MPLDALSLAWLCPGRPCRSSRGVIWEAPVQAVTWSGTALEFGHVEPTAVLGRGVQRTAIHKRWGGLWRNRVSQ